MNADAPSSASVLDLLSVLLRGETWPGTDIPHQELRKHHLRPLAHRAGVPGLDETYSQIAFFAAMHERTLRELQDVFARSSIAWTTIKGASYAWSLYPEPAQRPMSDMDLIVPASQFARAIEALQAVGYTTPVTIRGSRHAQTFYRREHEIVDLHRSILQPLRGNSRTDRFWERATSSTAFTGSVRFSDIDMAFIHIAHMARHEFVLPLIAHIDLQLLMARLSSEQERELRALLHAHNLGFAFRVLEELGARLRARGQRHLRSTQRIEFVLPSDTELVAREHHSRARQIGRKLTLFPGDAPALLASYCVDRWGDRLSKLRVP